MCFVNFSLLPLRRVRVVLADYPIYILILYRKGSRPAQLGQAVPPRCFTCNASAPVLRPRSSIVALALPMVPLFQ
jgi:hypothetical protein